MEAIWVAAEMRAGGAMHTQRLRWIPSARPGRTKRASVNARHRGRKDPRSCAFDTRRCSCSPPGDRPARPGVGQPVRGDSSRLKGRDGESFARAGQSFFPPWPDNDSSSIDHTQERSVRHGCVAQGFCDRFGGGRSWRHSRPWDWPTSEWASGQVEGLKKASPAPLAPGDRAAEPAAVDRKGRTEDGGCRCWPQGPIARCSTVDDKLAGDLAPPSWLGSTRAPPSR